MTIDQAIICEEEEAKYKELEAKMYAEKKQALSCAICISTASEHRQLAEWLRELKRYRDIISYEIEMTDQNNKAERVYVECLKDIKNFAETGKDNFTGKYVTYDDVACDKHCSLRKHGKCTVFDCIYNEEVKTDECNNHS